MIKDSRTTVCAVADMLKGLPNFIVIKLNIELSNGVKISFDNTNKEEGK